MQLPKDVNIESIIFEVGFAIKRHSQPIPTLLSGHGVTAIRKSDPSVEVDGKLTGTRAGMKSCVGVICKSLDLKANTVRVKRMTVTTNKGKTIDQYTV